MSERLQHRMIDYAVTPPPATWEAIAARLNDDEKYGLLSARMNQFEAVPPPMVWDSVLNDLDKQKNKKSISNTRRFVYRFAAAAIIAGVLIAGWAIFTREMVVSSLVKKITEPVIQPTGRNTISSTGTHNTIATDQHSLIAVPRDSRLPVIKHSKSFMGAASNENVLSSALINNPETLHFVATINAPAIPVKKRDLLTNIEALPMDGDYLIVERPDGQLTRISPKFSNVIRFLNGNDDSEDYLDKLIRESSSWKERFKEWRSKISESSYIPASVNFLDIMELKDLIQEEK